MHSKCLLLIFLFSLVFFLSCEKTYGQKKKAKNLRKSVECKKGYYKKGKECKKIIIPENAHLDSSGHDWECNRGYYKENGKCKIVKIPKNAHLNLSGHDWSCNKGYKRVKNKCIPLTPQDIENIKTLKELLNKIVNPSDYLVTNGIHCYNDFLSDIIVCLEIQEPQFKCQKSIVRDSFEYCIVSIPYLIKTNYAGDKILQANITCTATLKYKDTFNPLFRDNETSNSNSTFEIVSPFFTTDSSVEITFTFSIVQNVVFAKLIQVYCEIIGIDFY